MGIREWLDGAGDPPPGPIPTDAPEPVETVAVSLKTGATVLGALVHRTADSLILRAAVLVGVDRNQQETREHLDGDVVVLSENIDFYQSGLDPAVLLREELTRDR